METSKNNNDNNGGDEQPQLRNSARKRKFKLANAGRSAGGEENQQEQEEEGCSSKMSREGRNDPDLEQSVQLPQVTAQVQVTGAKEIADENEEEAELPMRQPMKVQLSKETWFEMLEFVGRRQLGQLVPQIGDRRFAGIAQSFLHNYGRITLADIYIYVPGHPLIQHVAEIPENVKDFLFISLSYLNMSVINLLQKFQQASLLGNVNLDLGIAGRNTLLKTLSHILPSIDNINSIRLRGANITQLAGLYTTDSGMAMLKMAQFLDIFLDDNFHFAHYEIAFLIRWLHTPRDDGKPRVLVFPYALISVDKIAHFIDGTIKSEFAKAKLPVCYIIRLFVLDTVDWHDSSMENGETKEKLVIKKVATSGPTSSKPTNHKTMALISRYPLGADKHWIEANELKAMDWDFHKQNGRICLTNSIRNAIIKMESNKNDDTNNGGDKQQQAQQLPRSARKRKLNELANDGKPAGGGEVQPKPEEDSSKKSREGRNDQDLEQIVQLPQVTAQVQMTGQKEVADENEKQVEEEAEMPRQPIKIQMSKETWFDMLEFVGRRQLGQLVPQIGDRRFANIAQSYLHNYGRITLADIYIYVPGHPLIQHVAEIPENVKDFLFISLSYIDTPVLNFLQKFQQASLFGNVNLDLRLRTFIFPWERDWDNTNMLQTLSHILPSIDNINSILGHTITQLVGLDNANSEAAIAILKMARFLDIFHDDFKFAPNEIAFLNRWLHTPRDDGKPRVLILPLDYSGAEAIDTIPHFIDDTIKKEFAMAKIPVCFFIRLFVHDTNDWQSNMENGATKEKLVIKKVATSELSNHQTMALISRYPLGAGKHWIETNEREALDWDFDEQNGRISLGNRFKNAI